MNTNVKTQKLVLASLFAALCCIGTMVIQIPSPTGGYIHLGDGFVLLSGIILGPVYGSLAAGLGSMLADVLSGYMQFAIATLLIKGLAAFFSALVYKKAVSLFGIVPVVLSGIIGGIIVTSGYLIFESFMLGSGLAAAVTGVPANIVQNIFGVIVASCLLPILYKIPYLKSLRA